MFLREKSLHLFVDPQPPVFSKVVVSRIAVMTLAQAGTKEQSDDSGVPQPKPPYPCLAKTTSRRLFRVISITFGDPETGRFAYGGLHLDR
jgi:hypothetical protein